jgi:hypothetical protein
MRNEPWTFIRDNKDEPILENWQAFIWCRDTLLLNDWDHTAEGYWFKNEQDALLFTLRWS